MAEQMKPSGIDWIGNIPLNWNAKKVKYVISDIKDGTHGTFDRVESGELLLSAKNVFNDGIRIGENESEISISDYKSIISNGFPKRNDILLCCVGTIGRCCVYEYDQSIAFQRSVAFLRPLQQTNARYLKYALQSDSTLVQEQLLINKSAQDGLYMGSVRELIIPYPNSKSEQQSIADFLDKECAQIDSIAADLEKQIALLQQYKKSLITETVTKGLNKSVPMKDSDIEGVGKIPSHWKVNRLKYAAVVKTGPFGTQLSASEYSDEGIPVINVKNIGYGTIIEDDLDYVPDEVCQRLAQHQLQLGDIVFGRKGAVDKHAIITESQIGWVQGSDCIRVRIDGDIDSRYLNYLFDTVYFAEYVLLYAVGTTMASINSDILTNSKILVPPITEQRCIADFLDSSCKTLFEIIENKQSQLATLQQHKKSLIYEYVTGKKRVKEVR